MSPGISSRADSFFKSQRLSSVRCRCKSGNHGSAVTNTGVWHLLLQLPKRIKPSEWKRRKGNNKNASTSSSRREGPITTGWSVRKIKVGDGSRFCWNSKAVGLHNHETWKLKYYWCSHCLFQDFIFCLALSQQVSIQSRTNHHRERKKDRDVCECVCVCKNVNKLGTGKTTKSIIYFASGYAHEY